MAAHQAPLFLGLSRQEHWSGLPFPSPMHESEKWKWSRSVMSDSWWPHRLQPTRLLHPWDFPGKSSGVGCHCLLLRIWSDLRKKKKDLCPPGIFILEYMQINMLKYVEDGKGYEEKSNWAGDWGHSEWLNEELSILNQPLTESFSDYWRINLNKVKKRVMWSSLWRVTMARQKQWKLQRLKKKKKK